VFLVDANVLLNAANEASLEHDAARNWLEQSLGESETVGFAWTVLVAFLRVSTHPRVFADPLPVRGAVELLEGWLGSPLSIVVEPSSLHLRRLSRVLEDAGRGGDLVGDAHLAAIALERNATVVSFDRDFARFEGLALLRPG